RFHHGGGAGDVVVGDYQTGVELRTHTVAGEVADHAVTETLGVGLDDTADHIDPASGAARLDAAHHGFLRTLDQETVLLGDVPGQEGGVGVTMHTVLVGGDVDVDDVAVAERGVLGGAVACDLVQRGGY